MCNFHSSISDGKGKVLFFHPSDISEIMSEGNPKSYDFNSHSQIGAYFNLDGIMYDRWNKWEYDPNTKELTQDTLCVEDDSGQVKKVLDSFFKGKNLPYLANMYNSNSGDSNSGDSNSGDSNSGNRNSGDSNSGNRNSGNRNSGSWNSGSWNSGDSNSGDWNSGNSNSGTVLGSYCSEKIYYLFNKPCTKEEHNKQYEISMSWFRLCEWIIKSKMTAKEKKEQHNYKVTGGYLKTIEYKQAWKKCPKDVLKQIKKLPNFNKKVFKEITGLL